MNEWQEKKEVVKYFNLNKPIMKEAMSAEESVHISDYTLCNRRKIKKRNKKNYENKKSKRNKKKRREMKKNDRKEYDKKNS